MPLHVLHGKSGPMTLLDTVSEPAENPESGILNQESSPVLLRADGLRIAFGGQTVLDGIDLELHRGEVVLLRGENGSGKTTLLNILTGNLEPDAGTIYYAADDTPRSYAFPRRWWQDLNPWDHFRPEFVAQEGLGRTWQDIRLFGAMTLRDNISVAEPRHPGENPVRALFAPGASRKREEEIDREADKILKGFGLEGREESSGDMVSLGQSKRVAIARAVAAGARILFLDEPLAGLDRPGIDSVLDVLKNLVREKDLTLVIIEHVFNQPHLHGLVTTDWLLERGALIHDSRLRTPDSNDQTPSSVALGREESGITDPESILNQDSGIRIQESLRPAWFSLLAGDNAEIIDEPLPRGALLTRIRRPDRWKPDAEPVLEIKGLIVNRGARTVIGLDEHGNPNGFDLTLHEGEIAILQAPNGWGKSTLFDAICGNAPSKSGAIALNGSPMESTPPWIRAQRGLAASPSAAKLFPSLKVSEVARLAPHSFSTDSNSIPFAERTVSSLSGGEKQRTLLRLALPDSKSPYLVLLDEPFAMLDDKATRDVVKQPLLTHPHHAILLLTPANYTSN